MPLDARKVAHVLANRARIGAGRGEVVVLVSVGSGSTVAYTPVEGQWYDAGAVPAGIAGRVGEITRAPYDALLVAPHAFVPPDGLRCVYRGAEAGPAGLAAATAAGLTYVVLDRRRIGLGTRGNGGGANAGNRWLFRLRQRRN